MKRLFHCLALLSLLSLSACRHAITINTTPANASVWVNFVPLGKSPKKFYARTGLPGSAHVKVSLDGYEPVRDFEINKSYHADWTLLWLIPGIIPYFFTASYEPEVTIPLKKIENTPVKKDQQPTKKSSSR